MHKIIHISTLTVAYCLVQVPLTHARTDTSEVVTKIDLEEVEIITSASNALFDAITRNVDNYHPNTDFSALQSVYDQLQFMSNIDIRARGKGGIQADVSIRGGSFDNSMVMLNGINITDPQSGHLSLFLPVESEAIDRIEILHGPAARKYGNNAFSGIINYTTEPSGHNRVQFNSSVGFWESGDNGESYSAFDHNSLTINFATKKVKNLLHYSNAFSNGYTLNTDYRRHNVFYQSGIKAKEGTFDLQFGTADRAFGANSYYTPAYPDQFEQNRLTLASVSFETGKKIKIKPAIYWRRHRDRFELFREDENWYGFENGILVINDSSSANINIDSMGWAYTNHNHHITDVFGAQLTMSTSTKLGKTGFGWHIKNNHLLSNNIGEERDTYVPVRGYPGVYYNKSDNRSNFDIHIDHSKRIDKLFISGGILLNWNSFAPEKVYVFPGIDLSYTLANYLELVGSYNYSAGQPTFTDLKYKDQSNIGNKDLSSYSQHSIEGGIIYTEPYYKTELRYFYTNGNEVIDWVWFPDDRAFRPVNTDEYISQGAEFSTLIILWPTELRSSVRLNYTFIDIYKKIPGNVSKYSNIRHKFSANMNHRFFEKIHLTWNLSYTERDGSYLTYNFESEEHISNSYTPYWLIDAKLTYKFKYLSVFIGSNNILNTSYIDIGSIEQPGRSFSVGLSCDINSKLSKYK